MGTTLQNKGTGAILPQQGAPPLHETVPPEQRIELHEMPDLTRETPEVEYGQPKRSWLRYLAVGVTVGAVAVGGGLLISSQLGGTDTGLTYGNEYSLAREHLAQAPGGFPIITAAGSIVASSEKLEMEHVAQTPGGFPTETMVVPHSAFLDMEHIAQTPGGFPTETVAVPHGAFLDAEPGTSTTTVVVPPEAFVE
jgi:hypothetical protein